MFTLETITIKDIFERCVQAISNQTEQKFENSLDYPPSSFIEST